MGLKINKIFKQVISGFSLIELMIVVAIIGILASVAVPSYESYMIKSKMSQLMETSSDLRKKIIEFYSVYGKLPAVNGETVNNIPSISSIMQIPITKYINNASSGVGKFESTVNAATTSIVAPGNPAIPGTSSASAIKYSIIGANTGLPAGEPVVQLQVYYITPTSTSNGGLFVDCKIFQISATTAQPYTASISYIPQNCSAVTTGQAF